MGLTDFGRACKRVRHRLGLSESLQAAAMGILPPLLRRIEHGEARLIGQHVDDAVEYLTDHGADDGEIAAIRAAGSVWVRK